MSDMDASPKRIWGRVKWFDQARGFGFVIAEDGGDDILLHANVLRSFGQTSVADGARVEILAQSTPRGAQAVVLLDIELSEHEDPEADHRLNGHAGTPVEAGPLQAARVKWYDRVKGFGFANTFGSSEDVFLHVDVLRRSGLSELMQGEAIAIRVTDGRRGKLAVEIKPWDYASSEH